VIDETISMPVSFPALRCELRAYQQKAVAELAAKRQGVLVSPCGSGKTLMGLEVIRLSGQRALILVHTLDLLEQWRSRIKTFFGIEPGTIGGGHWTEGELVTISTIQTLNKAMVPGFANNYGLIFQDESQHVPAWSFRSVIEQFPAKHRYGMSATPERQDGFSFLLHAVVGTTLHTVTDADLEAAGVLMTPSVKVIECTSTDFSDCADYADILEAVCNDDIRNENILRFVAKEASKGHSCLVLSERVVHGQRMNELFQRYGLTSATIAGQDSKAKRIEVLDAVSSGKTTVLFAQKLADEGLDIPRLSRVFLTCPVRSGNGVIQRVGRIKRPYPNKPDPVIFDFLDVDCGLAVSQFYTRRNKAYKGLHIELIKNGEKHEHVGDSTELFKRGTIDHSGTAKWDQSASDRSLEAFSGTPAN
jgi:superfamily II DNA or RNA helicase